MAGETFRYELLIREHHLDTFGHVNNAAYLDIFEEARWELITRNGYGLKEVKASGLGPVILEVTLRFRKELQLREPIIIETRCTDYRKKIGTLEQKIFNSSSVLCADAVFSFGLFDTNERKLVPPTERWLEAIGVALPDAVSKL